MSDFKRLWRVSKRDFLLMLLTIVLTVALGVMYGIAIAVGLSLLMTIQQSSRPHVAELGLVPGTSDAFRNVKRYPEVLRVPGVVIMRFDAPLFFANAEFFQQTLARLVVKHRPVRAVLVDCRQAKALLCCVCGFI